LSKTLIFSDTSGTMVIVHLHHYYLHKLGIICMQLTFRCFWLARYQCTGSPQVMCHYSNL